MGYLGTPPQSGFITTAKQRVTSSTNNYVDLDHAISSIADVIVFVNFVKQDTTNLSLTTSTRITLGGTLVSSDIVEIHYLGKAVNTQTPATGTVTADALAGSIGLDKLSATGTKSSSTFLRGDNTFATISTDIETPYAARLYKAGNQTISNATWTLLDLDASEVFDKGSVATANDSKITIPTGADGFWWFHANLRVNNFRANRNLLQLYKNGTAMGGTPAGDNSEFGYWGASSQYSNIDIVQFLSLSAGDYIEPYYRHKTSDSGALNVEGSSSSRLTYFYAYKLIGA